MTSLFDRQTLLQTFLPLSDSGKKCLEIILVHPDTQKSTGRGFFNDPDFLLEACRPFAGHFNFALSNFAYTAESIPETVGLNRFDRSSLLDDSHQHQGRAHSLTLQWLLKPEYLHNVESQFDPPEQILQIGYAIGQVMARLQSTRHTLDFFQTGMVLRIMPAFMQEKAVNKNELFALSKTLLARIGRELQEEENRKFALKCGIADALFDPLPGMPGSFSRENQDSIIVQSSGRLEPSNEPFIKEFIPSHAAPAAATNTPFTGANMLNLSQNWQVALPEEGGVKAEGKDHRPPGAESGFTAIKKSKASNGLAEEFLQKISASWSWPVSGSAFAKKHVSRCGSLLMLDCPPFSAAPGLQFLLQSAETGIKQGLGQVLVFSKKMGESDLALCALARHLHVDPLSTPNGKEPDVEHLAREYRTLFKLPPLAPPCSRDEGLRQIIRYLEHDYLIKQKNNGGGLPPLVIVLDNLHEFLPDSASEAYKDLCQLKRKLPEVNAALWILNARQTDSTPEDFYTLCDQRLSLQTGPSSDSNSPEKVSDSAWKEWEKHFPVDPALQKILPELSMVRIRFEAHGLHRDAWSRFLYHRPTRLFREIGS